MAKGIPAKQKKRMKQMMFLFIFICLPILVFSIFNISVIGHEKYESMAINQQTSDSVINAKRGTILDRNGNELAVSATAETVTINPKAINKNDDTEAVAIATELSEILGLDYDTVYKKTQANTFYQLIKRTVTEEEAEAVRKLKIELDTDAIILVEDTKRYYPNGSLASTVIGFCNVDGDGIEGIEAYYNDVLKGTSGRVVTAKDAVGSELPYEYETYVESEDGYDLVLTIDSTIQYYTDKYLEQALVDANVMNKATAIVMDVNTGEILAMSTKPDYDLNNPRTITDEADLAYLATLSGEEYSAAQLEAWQKMWRNKAISDTYEPGSVFKVITSSMALEDGTVSLSNSFDCAGRTVVNGTTIKCWKTAGHGHQSFQEALDNSCNCAFMAISSQIGSPSFYNYMTAFGFREKTGIDLNGESSSILHDRTVIENPITLAVASFGQTFKVTPIQMITAISAAVNGGNLLEPHLVKEIRDTEGNVIKSVGTTVKRQVISEETSETIAKMMEHVVEDGTGKNAYIKGYRVGGKTATSEKRDQADEFGNTTAYAVSFMGIAPSDDPQIAVLVILDEPDTPTVSGGAQAGPVVRNILEAALPYLGITPEYTAEELASMAHTVENYTGMTVEQAQSTAKTAGYTLRIIGNGTTVNSQMPRSGSSLNSGGLLVLYTDDSALQRVSVPDLTGLTVSQATSLLNSSTLNIQLNGNYMDASDAIAISQSVATGTEVEKGSVITVTFYNPNIRDD